jgi:hypothetical protein
MMVTPVLLDAPSIGDDDEEGERERERERERGWGK